MFRNPEIIKIALAFSTTNSSFWFPRLKSLLNELDTSLKVKFCGDVQSLDSFSPDIIIAHETDFLIEYVGKSPTTLRWIQLMSAGADKLISVLLMKAPHVTLTNMKGLHARAMGEYCLATILSIKKSITFYVKSQIRSSWVRNRSALLEGQSALVVGAGSIGCGVGEILDKFGLIVDCVATSIKDRDFFRDTYFLSDLQKIVGNYDYIICALPLTRSTYKLFDKGIFDCFSSDSIFINISRGSIVDQNDLIDSLVNNRIAFAVLDVFEREPLDVNDPLWKVDNLLITPHVAGYFEGGAIEGESIVRENICAFLKGRDLRSIIDLEKGY